MPRMAIAFFRAAYEGFNRGARERNLRPWMERFFDPDVEWHLAEEGPDPGPFRGHASVLRQFDVWFDVWDEWWIEPEELIDAGDAWVVVDHMHARGRGSGAEVAMLNAHVFRFRGERIVEVRDYSSREAALRAAGIAGRAGRPLTRTRA